MGIQLKGGNGGGNLRQSRNSMGMQDIEETPQMKEQRLKREAAAAQAKKALEEQKEAQRQKVLAYEQRDAVKREREELEAIKNNPQLAAERERRLAAMKAEEEQRAKFKAEEEAKIEAERRVQEKKMDQTEALIAAIRAQVEKEKAAKEAANKKEEVKASSAKSSSSANAKPQFRTISPEEMAKLEEKKRMKASGIQPGSAPKSDGVGANDGITGGLNGLVGGPTLSNPSGGGPTLTNPTAGQQSLNNVGTTGGGLGIDITAKTNQASDADESTVALDVNAINAAAQTSQGQTPPKPHTPVQVVGESSTIIVDDGNSSWNGSGSGSANGDEISWVESGVEPKHVKEPGAQQKNSLIDENGDIVSVVPVKQKPIGANDVQSAYNIDFDDQDDDDDLTSFGMSSSAAAEEARQKAEEEARRKAEEEARRKAEEEARRKAEEEARRKAEEEARRKAEEEARRKAEEEARRKAEEEARRKAEEEARRKAEEEARRKAEEEARRKAEEEARRKAEEEARRKAEEEARRKAEEEARRKAEEEARRKAEEEARRKAEEEARRKAEEEEARRKAEEEARRKAEEEEARRKAEEEARRKAEEEEVRRKAEEEAEKYRRLAEEAERKAEEAKKALEAAQRAASVASSYNTETKAEPSASSAGYALPVGAEQYLGKYLSVASISEQITKAIKYISDNPSEPRNIVILGQYGFGTTAIAEDFARSFYAMGICKTKTIAKIKAGALNRANISDAISKLQGGCLVVENAGVITNEKLGELYQIVSNPDNDVVIIMTGQIDTLSRIFKDNIVISGQFKHLIQVHRITDMDVLDIAKNHAVSSGYPCDSGAESSLKRRMQEVESGNLDRVLKIVDNAVSKAHNREMGTGEQEHHLIAADFE